MSGAYRNRTLAAATLALVAGAIVLAILLALWAPELSQMPPQVINKDFANYWMAGRLSISGDTSVLFGPPEPYLAAMRQVFGPDYPWHNWSYPPHAVLPLIPLGLLDFLPALALFAGVTLALYFLGLSALDARWSAMSVLLLLPFIAANLVATQNGFLTAALLVGGLATRSSRPLLAGILFGILTFKPQLGLLVPFLLLAERRWLVIGAATLTTAALVLLSALIFGFDSWESYFRHVAPYQTEVMNTLGGDFPFMMGSGFGAARAYGFTGGTAMLVHLPFMAAGIVLFGVSLWKVGDQHARALAMLLSSLLVVPYSVAYDFGSVAAFAALWPIAAQPSPAPARLRLSLQAVAILPIAMLPLAKAGLPLAPVVLMAALIFLLESQGAFAAGRVSAKGPSIE